RTVCSCVRPTAQLTDGGPSVTPELSNAFAGPPFGGALGSASSVTPNAENSSLSPRSEPTVMVTQMPCLVERLSVTVVLSGSVHWVPSPPTHISPWNSTLRDDLTFETSPTAPSKYCPFLVGEPPSKLVAITSNIELTSGLSSATPS